MNAWGEALYTLAREEGLSHIILAQLMVLEGCFREEPAFLRLLDEASLPKQERCDILDDCFRGRVEGYLLNCLKLLTETGSIRQFPHCVGTFRSLYNQDNGIMVVAVLTAVPLSDRQKKNLCDKLQRITCKKIQLACSVDPGILGGIRLDFDGKCLDDTVSHRLESIAHILKNTVL